MTSSSSSPIPQPRCWVCGKFCQKPHNELTRLQLICKRGHEEVRWYVGPTSTVNWAPVDEARAATTYFVDRFVDHAVEHVPCP